MNANQIVNMVIRMVMRTLMRKGMNAASRKMSKGGATGKPVPGSADAQKRMRMARRAGRF